MSTSKIVDELHRHREAMLHECGDDPTVLVRQIQERERASDRRILLPPPARALPILSTGR